MPFHLRSRISEDQITTIGPPLRTWKGGYDKRLLPAYVDSECHDSASQFPVWLEDKASSHGIASCFGAKLESLQTLLPPFWARRIYLSKSP